MGAANLFGDGFKVLPELLCSQGHSVVVRRRENLIIANNATMPWVASGREKREERRERGSV